MQYTKERGREGRREEDRLIPEGPGRRGRGDDRVILKVGFAK